MQLIQNFFQVIKFLLKEAGTKAHGSYALLEIVVWFLRTQFLLTVALTLC